MLHHILLLVDILYSLGHKLVLQFYKSKSLRTGTTPAISGIPGICEMTPSYK